MIIYLAYCPESGKGYIGQTTRTVSIRWSGHKNRVKEGCTLPLHSAMRKYGHESFELTILATAQTLEELNYLEVEYIKKYNTLVPEGYNLASGGGVRMWHPESRVKIALANSRRVTTAATRDKRRKLMLGNTYTKGMRGIFHHSEASKERHSAARKLVIANRKVV